MTGCLAQGINIYIMAFAIPQVEWELGLVPNITSTFITTPLP
jgi:hypothetical protein